MLVPLIVVLLQLAVPASPSSFAETIDDPGIVRSGLIRRSSVQPQLEKLDISPALVPRRVEPTERPFLFVDGVPTVSLPGPELPAANSTRKSGWLHMNSSTSALAAE